MEILRENIEDHLEIRLDEVTDILLLVNSDGLLPNIEVSLMNSRDTILGQLRPGRENDVIIHSQLRRIREDIDERYLDHCVIQRRGTIENLYDRLSGLRRDVSMVSSRILVDRYIRNKMRDHLPRTFGILDHIEMELTGSRTVNVSHIQTLASVVVVGSSLSGRGEQAQQIVISLGEDMAKWQSWRYISTCRISQMLDCRYLRVHVSVT